MTLKSATREQTRIAAGLAIYRISFQMMDMALKADNLKLFSKHMNLWSKRLETVKAIHHKIDLEKATQPIRKQPNRAGKDLERCFSSK